MTKITLIAALAANGAIGIRGDMIYHISEDLKRFKSLTMGKPVVMGRKTFESLPGGALSGRRNIVITSQPDYDAAGAETASSVEEALAMCALSPEVMVIGGASVYRQALPLADEIELTLVDNTPAEADTFFPDIDPTEWQISEQSEPQTDPRSGVQFRFVCLSRKL